MNTQSRSKLYLIPTPIHEDSGIHGLPAVVQEIVQTLRVFIVEEEKTARHFLKSLSVDFPLSEITFFVYNEHSHPNEAIGILDKIGQRDCGLLSEAGVPCVADPGAQIVAAAHARGVEVVPLVGPSSILLALMASGFNGQRFCFYGYLPKDKNERMKKLKELERRSAQEHEAQIFMEVPYRNENLFKDILEVCQKDTRLCVACDLMSAEQFIKTMTVDRWRKDMPSLNKRPTIFLLEKK